MKTEINASPIFGNAVFISSGKCLLFFCFENNQRAVSGKVKKKTNTTKSPGTLYLDQLTCDWITHETARRLVLFLAVCAWLWFRGSGLGLWIPRDAVPLKLDVIQIPGTLTCQQLRVPQTPSDLRWPER